MSSRIYFVRHGQTQANVEQYAQGSDEPLNDIGLKQAAVVAERCKTLGFDAIISSDMKRAQQTAEAISSATGKPLETSQLLREVTLADVFNGAEQRGKAIEINQELPQQLDNEEWFRERGMESYRVVQGRVRETMTFLEERPEENLLVVTHGTFFKFLIGELIIGDSATMAQLHAFRSRVRLTNTGISMIEFDDGLGHWLVRHLNDINHFAE